MDIASKGAQIDPLRRGLRRPVVLVMLLATVVTWVQDSTAASTGAGISAFPQRRALEAIRGTEFNVKYAKSEHELAKRSRARRGMGEGEEGNGMGREEDVVTSTTTASTTTAAPTAAPTLTPTAASTDHFCKDWWNGGILHAEKPMLGRVHLVVSHCNKNLGWLPAYVNMTTFETITIISKCGLLPTPTYGARTVTLPNLGGCDHTYAWWMLNVALADGGRLDDDDLVLFMKDSHHVRSMGAPSFALALANITFQAANANGFACAVRPGLRASQQARGSELPPRNIRWQGTSISAFAQTAALDEFSMGHYNRAGVANVPTDLDAQPFKSSHKNLGAWRRHVGMRWTSPVVSVCFGGMFAAKVKNIKSHRHALQQALDSLSRANNLEEGHFMERSWAALLQEPLSPEDVTIVTKYTTSPTTIGLLPHLKMMVYTDCPAKEKRKGTLRERNRVR